jgi:hypothetical protein
MQFFVLVLNKTEVLEDILHQMALAGIKGATVLESTGMARLLKDVDDMPFFSGLRSMLNQNRSQSNTVFVVLEDNQVSTARKIVNEVTGGLDKPDTGIMFSLPTLFVEGINKK